MDVDMPVLCPFLRNDEDNGKDGRYCPTCYYRTSAGHCIQLEEQAIPGELENNVITKLSKILEDMNNEVARIEATDTNSDVLRAIDDMISALFSMNRILGDYTMQDGRDWERDRDDDERLWDRED